MLLCWRPQPTGSQTRTQKPLTAKIANRQPSIHTNPTHPPIHPPATSTIFHSTANCVYHTHAFVHVNQPPTTTASLPHRGPVFFFSHPTCAGHIYIDRDKGFLSNEYRQYQIDQSNLSSLVDFPNTTLLTSRNRIVIGKVWPTHLLDTITRSCRFRLFSWMTTKAPLSRDAELPLRSFHFIWCMQCKCTVQAHPHSLMTHSRLVTPLHISFCIGSDRICIIRVTRKRLFLQGSTNCFI